MSPRRLRLPASILVGAVCLALLSGRVPLGFDVRLAFLVPLFFLGMLSNAWVVLAATGLALARFLAFPPAEVAALPVGDLAQWRVQTLLIGLCGLGLGYVNDLRRQLATHKAASRRAELDPLTGLYNRTGFETKLARLIEKRKERDSLMAVLFVDLDRFKAVNDTYGHDAGDELLKTVAHVLRSNVRKGDLVARVGGDEFILALSGLREADSAASIAANLLRLLNSTFEIAGKKLSIGASIGISMCPDDGEDIETLVKNADNAMYHIKGSGKNRFTFSTQEMRVQQSRRQEIEKRLRWALEEGEFELRYQPQYHLADGTLTGFEALLRWRSPDLGLVTPSEFVPIAEESGLIVPLGHWLLREACRQATAWRAQGHPELTMAVNVSPLQIVQDDFLSTIEGALADAKLPASALELEITENVFVRDPHAVAVKLHKLNRLGVRTALDDFGTGYSSLKHLIELPIDVIKIDGAFVDEIGTTSNASRSGSAVVEATCALAAKLEKTVVAERVESEDQVRFLRAIGCHRVQGFLFSKPLQVKQIGALLEREAKKRASLAPAAPAPTTAPAVPPAQASVEYRFEDDFSFDVDVLTHREG